MAKVWRISDCGLSGPKWGIYITPLSYSSGNLVEEGVGRIEEQHVGETYCGTVSFGCGMANALMNTLHTYIKNIHFKKAILVKH